MTVCAVMNHQLCAAIRTKHFADILVRNTVFDRYRLAGFQHGFYPTTVLSHLLHQLTRLFVNDGFLRVLEDHPLFHRKEYLFF